MSGIRRRTVLGLVGAGSVAFLAAPHVARGAVGRAVVIGGGYGGTTAARYLKLRAPGLEVTLIEPERRYVTALGSNLVMAGIGGFETLGRGYDALAAAGVEVIHDRAEDIDIDARNVVTGSGAVVGYDALVLSPGIDMRWDALPGYDEAAAEKAPHGWKGEAQFQLLRAQLEAMPDGGTFVMVVPDNPYRCPSAPYERASLIAHYFAQAKPRSKILILDAKDAFSIETRFREAWPVLYGDMIEWVARSNDGRVLRVDAATLEVETEFGERIRADVLNVIPPQQAGAIAWRAGLVEERYGFAPVKAETFESEIAPDIYVIGDAAIAVPMPKSAFLANGQAKAVAAAIVAKLEGREPPKPSWINTCYALIAPDYGVSTASVYRVENGAIAEIGAGTVDGTSPLHGGPRFRAAEAANALASNRALAADGWGSAE